MPTPTPARWDLPDHPSLEWLRGRAKQLRRRYADGDPLALELVATYDPGDGAVPLSRAQRVLARAFGFTGWAALKRHVEAIDAWSRPMEAAADDDDRVDAFLRAACLSYTEPYAVGVARGLLAADPSLATASAATMAVTGRADDLRALLASDPGAATRADGPHRWPPVLHLAYSRLGTGDAVATLRVLLDAGADPDSGFLWQGFMSPFTAVTGVLGGGERDEPPHPQAAALVELLLDAGADPNDNQAFYNRMFRPDDSHLPPLLRHGAGTERPSPWRARFGSAYPSAEEMLGEHLRSAAESGYADRVRLLLAHGVDPNTRGYHPLLGDQTAYEVAVRHGRPEIARLLAEAGGTSDRIDADDLLVAAALAGELQEPVPGLPARRPDAVRLAGAKHGAAALAGLLALGYDLSQPGTWGTTALHEAAMRGDVETCRWLVAHGADRDARDERFDSTPAGWAAHEGHPELAAELEP